MPVDLTKVLGVISCFFLAEISEGTGECGFELGFEGHVGKGKRDERSGKILLSLRSDLHSLATKHVRHVGIP